jgi:hypothetical protein
MLRMFPIINSLEQGFIATAFQFRFIIRHSEVQAGRLQLNTCQLLIHADNLLSENLNRAKNKKPPLAASKMGFL